MTRNQQCTWKITIVSNNTTGRITWISFSVQTQMVARAFHWNTALHAGRSRVWFPMVSKSFRPQYVTGVNLSSNSNKYQEYFSQGVQGGRCVELTLSPLCAHVYVSKSGNLNLLETSGPVICRYKDCFTIFTIFTNSDFHTFKVDDKIIIM
jgi:hypothetical protein